MVDLTKADNDLLKEIGKYYMDPLGYVLFVFPWATKESIQVVDWYSEEMNEATGKCLCDEMKPYQKLFPNVHFGPDKWACDFLTDLGKEIERNAFNGKQAVSPILRATASGHGIGKSVMVAWLIKFIMDTRPLSKGTVTANTAEQLKTKTWAELGKWHKLSLTRDWFNYNSGRGAMNLTHVKYKEEWRCDAQTCREENSEAFAGQHAATATSFYIFDEASAVPDKIFEVREGGTTDGEPMVFDFGNPTRNSGSFFEECAGRFRHRYKVTCIDSREVFITNKTRINQWIEDYGIDSDFVKVRVLGQFPSAGSLQFIPVDLVEEAQQRETYKDNAAPLIIGVDVARFGDDESVIYPRIGMDARSFAPTTQEGRYRGLDTVQLTGKVIETVRRFKSMGLETSAIFVDGGGVGGGVVDQLMHLGYSPHEVQFGGKATESATYRYKSDEMWGNLRDALPRLCIPSNMQTCGLDLRADLTQREYGYTLTGNKIHLETKKDMKARKLASPDIADALALTFAEKVSPVMTAMGGMKAQQVIHEYDPLDTKDI